MRHCTRCRADALGLLGGVPEMGIQMVREFSRNPSTPSDDRPYVAVASLEGVLVNQHLAKRPICGSWARRWRYRHLDSREVPDPDRENNAGSSWPHNCAIAILSGQSGGEMPRNTLAQQGSKFIETDGMILSVLQDLYSGKALAPMRRETVLCGTECGGNGFGCA
jgi:nitrogen fixation protein NifB